MTTDIWLSALLIFCMRLADVPVGTVRIGMLVRGYRLAAGVLSFAESSLWLIATAQTITNLDNPVKFIAFAGGYAVGTMLGVTIDNRLALGMSVLRVIAPIDSPSVADKLRDFGFDMTVINAEGHRGEVRITFGIIPRRHQDRLLKLIYDINPEALVSIEATTAADLRRYATSNRAAHWQLRLLK